MSIGMWRRGVIAAVATVIGMAVGTATPGCSTAPKAEDQSAFRADAATARRWFEQNVSGLAGQIDSSAAYIIYPEVYQYGIMITGGQFGRGSLNRGSNDSQIGWAALNTGSLGLQGGVRGFKMLVVLEDEATLQKFKENRLSGGVSGVVVAGEEGMSQKANFENGVAIYQGASSGLMGGVNVGLDVMRYEPM